MEKRLRERVRVQKQQDKKQRRVQRVQRLWAVEGDDADGTLPLHQDVGEFCAAHLRPLSDVVPWWT